MSSYTIPNVIAQHPRGERIMDVYSHLLTERIVYLGTAIDPGVANTLIAQLLHLEADSAEQEINLYINCEGGDLPSMLAVYDTMQYIEAPVATTCVGQAIGVGAVLLAAGAPGRRALLSHARVVLHQPAGRGQGPIPDLILQADELVRMRADIESILSAHTGQSVQTLRADTDRDRVLTAQAALDYGIVDQVLGQRDGGTTGRTGTACPPESRAGRGLGGEGEDVAWAGAARAAPARGAKACWRRRSTGDLLSEIDERRAQRAGQGRDHLAGGFLAAALDLGEVLGRDTRPGPPSRTVSPAVPAAGAGAAGRVLPARGAPGAAVPAEVPGGASARVRVGVRVAADTRSRARPYLSVRALKALSRVVSLPADPSGFSESGALPDRGVLSKSHNRPASSRVGS